jgi:tetratricopeptide (TPR) repeat protein
VLQSKNEIRNIGSMKNRYLWLVLTVAAAAFLLTHYGGVRSPDSEVVFRTAEQLATRGSFAIDTLHTWPGFGTAKGVDGQNYSVFGPLQSIVLVPFIAVAQQINATHWYEAYPSLLKPSYHVHEHFAKALLGRTDENRPAHALRFLVSFSNVLIILLSVAILYRIVLRLTVSPVVAGWVSVLFALGTMAWSYAGTMFSEPLATCLTLLSLASLVNARSQLMEKRSISWVTMTFAGVWIGLATAAHVSAILSAPFFFAYAFFLHKAEHRGLMNRIRMLLPMLAGFGVVLLLLGWFNYTRFGDFLETGRTVDPGAVGKFGYGEFVWPWQGLLGLTLSPGKGLLWYVPVAVVGFIGTRALYRFDRYLSVTLVGAVVFRILFIAMRSDWAGGYCLGPRLLLVIVPLMLIPLAMWLKVRSDLRDRRALLMAVVLSGVFILEQFYLALGEIFSFYHLKSAGAVSDGLNPFKDGHLYLSSDFAPVFHILNFVRGSFLLKGVPLSNLEIVCIVAFIVGGITWYFSSLIQKSNPVGRTDRVPLLRPLTDSTMKNYHKLLLAVLCLGFFVLGIVTITNLNVYTPDSSRYFLWAQSLARGEGFIDRTAPEAARHVVHAPLYPVILAPIAYLWPGNVIALKVFTVALALVGIFLVHRWLTWHVSANAAVAATLMFALSPLVFLYSTELLSDVPFVACLILVMILVDRLWSSRLSQTQTRMLLVLTATLTAAILLRELGIALLLAVVIGFLTRKERLHAAFVGGVPVAVYGLWYVRNELLVASIEQPSLTNARLLAQHFFTTPGSSLVAEYVARIQNNLSIYIEGIPGLVFYPTYVTTPSLMVSQLEPAILAVRGVVQYGMYAVGLLTLALVSVGWLGDHRNAPAGKFRTVFMVFYLGLILVYPITDRRFLLPLLVMMIFYLVLGASHLLRDVPWLSNRTIRLAVGTGLIILLIPSAVWIERMATNARAYNRSPVEFVNAQLSKEGYAWHYTKLFPQVGDWINEHSEPHAVVLSQWKDLAIWLKPPRTLYPMDQTVSVNELDAAIRDYGVTHLVSMASMGGPQEFDFAMLTSRRYTFVPRFQTGNTIVYSVENQSDSIVSPLAASDFSRGLKSLNDGQYEEADSFFTKVESKYTRMMPIRYFRGVSCALRERFEEADSLLTSVASFGQAGIYLYAAASQLQTLRLVRAASDHIDRPAMLVGAAMRYFYAGFHKRALGLVERVIHEDSAYAPAHVSSVQFYLGIGDTVRAYHTFLSLCALLPDHPAAVGFDAVFANFDSLHVRHSQHERSVYHSRLAVIFKELGMIESAIDNARLAIRDDPTNDLIAVHLGWMYRLTKRPLPALRAYELALSADSSSILARENISALRRRLYLPDAAGGFTASDRPAN